MSGERDETKQSDYGYVLRVSGPLIVGTAMVNFRLVFKFND